MLEQNRNRLSVIRKIIWMKAKDRAQDGSRGTGGGSGQNTSKSCALAFYSSGRRWEFASSSTQSLFRVDHSRVAAGNRARRSGLIERAGTRTVTEGLGSVAAPIRIPLINDHLDRHPASPKFSSSTSPGRSARPAADDRARGRRASGGGTPRHAGGDALSSASGSSTFKLLTL